MKTASSLFLKNDLFTVSHHVARYWIGAKGEQAMHPALVWLLERIQKFKRRNRNVRSVRSNFLLTAPISFSRLGAENSPAAGDRPKRHKWRQFTVVRLGFID
jgi:hypothetical protein